MVTKIDKDKHEAITSRIKRGDMLQVVADDYGVSRERIRQIAAEAGVHPRNVKRAKKNAQISEVALEIIEDREQWKPAAFSTRGFTRQQFERFLLDHNSALWKRWKFADELPMSNTGAATPNGRSCTTCKIRKPWSQYYRSRTGLNGKSIRCIDCTKEQVERFRLLRHIEEPTVDEKVCTHCKNLKSADAFSRSTTNTTGLQSWCKNCQRDAG